MISSCAIKTLYLRNVPDDVRTRLVALADREGLSVSAFVVRELAAISRRADNPGLLADLPGLDVEASEIVGDIDSARAAR